MARSTKGKKTVLNMLSLVPVKRLTSTMKDGRAVILAPRTRSALLKRLAGLLGYDPKIRVNVDEIGTFVWLHIDGKRTVEAICALSGKHFGSKIEPCEARVCAFLRTLEDSGMISFKKESVERARALKKKVDENE